MRRIARSNNFILSLQQLSPNTKYQGIHVRWQARPAVHRTRMIFWVLFGSRQKEQEAKPAEHLILPVPIVI